jgi:DNA polymerase III epsilon subunit-like protein
MKYAKVVFLDTETISLDPRIASIREISYVKEIDGEQVGEIQAYKVQPILHMEDKLYGDQDIHEFCRKYNAKVGHPADPDCLVPFGFQGGDPLFFHSKAALTFNLAPPKVLDPADWLLNKELLPPYQVAMKLLDYMNDDHGVQGRWVLAGHNIKYDFEVITWWLKRLLGEDESRYIIDKFNKFVFLDTLQLARWFQYSGRLQTERANLSAVAEELGLDTSAMHTATADVIACRTIARRLLGIENENDNAREQARSVDSSGNDV